MRGIRDSGFGIRDSGFGIQSIFPALPNSIFARLSGSRVVMKRGEWHGQTAVKRNTCVECRLAQNITNIRFRVSRTGLLVLCVCFLKDNVYSLLSVCYIMPITIKFNFSISNKTWWGKPIIVERKLVFFPL